MAAALPFDEFCAVFFPALREKVSHEPRTAYALDKALPEAFYHGARSVVALAESGVVLQRFLDLRLPKVYVHGDSEKSRQMQILPILNGKVELKEISGSGHFMMKDNPLKFYEWLREFVDRVT